MPRNGFVQIMIGVIVAVIVFGIGGYVLISQKRAPAPAENIQPDAHREVVNETLSQAPRQETKSTDRDTAPETSGAPEAKRSPSAGSRTTRAPVSRAPGFPSPASVEAPAAPAASADLQELRREINALAQTGRPIGQDHYRGLQERIRRAETAGADTAEIAELRSILEPLDPAKIPLITAPRTAFRKDPEIPAAGEMANIPPCENKRFVTPPVDLTRIYEISPLGAIGPPGHTFPTEHLFFHIHATGASTETIPLLTPADVHLTLISFSSGLTNDPVDYTLWFALCRDVIGYFNHVKAVSPELDAIVSRNECKFSGESKQTRCTIETLTQMKNGALMGYVGGYQGNFDFGAFDLSKTLLFANPSRYGTRSLHIQCALDYYGETFKNRMALLIARPDKHCGVVAQDIPGTLKGNWFFGASRADLGSDWDKHLGFLQDNGDPGLSVVSVGGTFTKSGKWEFRPLSSGFVNRSFGEVKPDGYVYCYEAAKQSGRILVEMTSPAELKIEHQQKACSESMVFVDPITYKR